MKQVVMFLVTLFFSVEVFGQLTKPVDVRDYDLTYTGISGTGSVGYSTLYRDNYDGGSACGCGEGEGTGGHPGVDILVSTGTDVYSIADGTIQSLVTTCTGNDCEESGACGSGWGNHVIIKHDVGDIEDIDEVVYSVYAHLNSVENLSVNDEVSASEKIGESGNTGNSCGAHLHFQIDRATRLDNGNTISHPYWPPDPNPENDDGTVDEQDVTHEIEKATINPMLFVKYLNVAPVGFFDDGNDVYTWHTNGTSQAIVDRFFKAADDGNFIGYSWNNGPYAGFAHTQEGVTLQDFYGDNTNFYHGYTAIIVDADDNDEAHLLKEGFWVWYMTSKDYNGTWKPRGLVELGAPTSEEYTTGSLTRQDFEDGYLLYDPNTNQVTGYDNADFKIAAVVELSVDIHSVPSGAEIWEGGNLLTTTPLEVNIEQGQSRTFTTKLTGYYDKTFTLDWTDGGQVVTVELEPTSTGSGGTGGSYDLMAISPLFLDFGSTKNNLALSISKETTVNDLAWTATPNQSWITCTPSSGTATSVPSTVTVNIDYAGLSGKYEESITISSSAGSISLPILLDANSQWPNSPITYDFSAGSQLDDWLLIDGTPDSSGIKNEALKLVNGEPGTTSAWTEGYATAAGAIFEEVSVTFTMDNGVSEGSNQITDIRLCFVDKNNYYTWQIKEDNRSGEHRSYTKLMQVSSGGETDLTQEFASLPSGIYTASYTNGIIRLVDNQGGSVFDQSVNVGTGLYGRIGFAVNEETTTFDNISIDGTTANFLLADKTSLDFGTELVKQTIQITGLGGENVAWQVSAKPSWLNTHISSGTAPDSIVCSADRSVLTTGTHTGNLILSSGGGSRTIPVSVDVPKLLFSDDFSNGINVPWSIPKPNWSIVSGELKQTPHSQGQRALVMSQAASNVAMEVDWRQTGLSGNRLSFFYIHANSDLSCYYRATVNKANNTVELEKKVNGSVVMMRIEAVAVPDGRYRVAVKNDILYFAGLDAGSTISLSAYDGSLGTMPTGYHGVGLDGDEVYIDNIEIYDLDDITPPNTPILVLPTTQDIGSASSSTLSDSLLLQSTGTAEVAGTIATTGNISLDSSVVNLASGQNRKYGVTVNLDAISDGSYSDTVKVSYSGNLATTVVTYEKSATPSSVLGEWYMDGAVCSNAKRTNESTGALLTEAGSLTSTTGHTGSTDEAYSFSTAYLKTDVTPDGVSQLTIAMWVQTSSSTYDQLFGRWEIGYRQIVGGWHTGNRLNFTFAQNVNDSGGGSNSYAYTPSRDTGWHHIVFVYDGTVAPADRSKIYYDGQALATTIDGTIPTSLISVNSSAHPMIIGHYEASFSGGPLHTGAIDYVQIDGVTWTASEVSSDYTGGLAKHASNITADDPVLPTEFALHQNYPNPFNPITRIRYDLPETVQVTLTIFNVLGQRILTLVDTVVPAGEHNLIWDSRDSFGRQVATGIYIYRLQAGNFVQSRKMLLLK